jgi:dihydrolipoamide dehydrogenase
MNTYDVIVIGGGPGGYAAAVRSSNWGLKTVLIEKEALGGTCVNWGCVPTKAMLKCARNMYIQSRLKSYDFLYQNVPHDYALIKRKSFEIAARQSQRVKDLVNNSKITLVAGEASLLSANEVEIRPSGEKISGKYIILAPGTIARKIPGVAYDDDTIVTTREAFNFAKPPSSAVVIGSGAAGLEFATLWKRFGSKVTVLEVLPVILPNEDEDVSRAAEAHLQHSGIRVSSGVKVESVVKNPEGVAVTYSDAAGRETLVVEKVLASIGIVPNVANLGLERAGVAATPRCIEINDKMQTNVPNIYAIGDVTGKLALGVVAVIQGNIAADAIAGKPTETIVYDNILRCVYSEVEVASAGLTEKRARERGYEVRTSKQPLTSGGSTSTLDEYGGFIKLVVDARSERLLGAHLIGHKATELIGGPAALIASGGTVPRSEEVLLAF